VNTSRKRRRRDADIRSAAAAAAAARRSVTIGGGGVSKMSAAAARRRRRTALEQNWICNDEHSLWPINASRLIDRVICFQTNMNFLPQYHHRSH